MIGCKVTRTLSSVEFEIILILVLPCCLSSSSVRSLENVVETDTESEPFEDLVETETPKSPHTVASPTSLIDSTPPTCHVEESEHSNTSEVAAMSDSAFRKRFRSSYDSSPSPTLPVRKRYRGTSELILDTDEEEEDEEAEESLDSDNESEDIDDEGFAAKNEGPATGDDGLAAGDEGPDIRVESLGLGGDEAVPEGQQWATPVLDTPVGEPLGLGYGALRHREIASREGQMPNVFEVGQGSGSVPEPERPERVSAFRQPTLTTCIDPEDGRTYIDVPAYPPSAPPVQKPLSPEWSSYSLPISPAPSIVLSPISSPMISLTVPSPVASPTTAEAEGFLTKLGAYVEIYRED
uniref:Uncharacterized protein n=1 Tax=Tanacetum cinerariifolium TaxID=118510 RepID=A0A699HT20_TANCI|nr:hypothetical protein [Tanacetum cinerariifolium]